MLLPFIKYYLDVADRESCCFFSWKKRLIHKCIVAEAIADVEGNVRFVAASQKSEKPVAMRDLKVL